jgi:hypothetical protein
VARPYRGGLGKLERHVAIVAGYQVSMPLLAAAASVLAAASVQVRPMRRDFSATLIGDSSASQRI